MQASRSAPSVTRRTRARLGLSDRAGDDEEHHDDDGGDTHHQKESSRCCGHSSPLTLFEHLHPRTSVNPVADAPGRRLGITRAGIPCRLHIDRLRPAVRRESPSHHHCRTARRTCRLRSLHRPPQRRSPGAPSVVVSTRPSPHASPAERSSASPIRVSSSGSRERADHGMGITTRGRAPLAQSARDLGVPDPNPVLAIANRLVGHYDPAHGAHEGEGRERRDRHCSGDKGD